MHDGGEFEIGSLPALLGKRSPLILEIGAADGEHSLLFLQQLPHARLFCFEPDARAIALWRSRMAGRSATLIEAAVGNETGNTTFHPSGGMRKPTDKREWYKSGSIKRPTGNLTRRHPTITFNTTVTVPITKLDDWTAANSIGEIDFIWADVQGAEDALIEGACKTLERTRFFYTEYSQVDLYSGQWTLEMIAERLPNFVLLVRYRRDALFVRKTQIP